MYRRPYGAPRLPLLPLLLTLSLIFWLISGGCTLLSSRFYPRTPEQQERVAQERIEFALKSLERGDSGAADKALNDAVRVMENNSRAVEWVAAEVTRRGRPAAAVRILDRAMKNPDVAASPRVWVRLAEAHDKAGDTAQAGPAAEEAERRAAAILATAGKLAPLKRETAPSQTLSQAVQRFRQTGLYYRYDKNDAEKTFLAFREVMRLLPGDPVAKNDLGYFLADLGTTTEQFDEALYLTRVAAEALPDSGRVLDSYGWALFKKGDLLAARRILKSAVDLSPDLAEIRYHFGRVLQAMGQTDGALLEMERALLLQPDWIDARRARDELRAILQPKPSPSATPSPEPKAESGATD
jgi:Tfp pilus assembly protein PilF